MTQELLVQRTTSPKAMIGMSALLALNALSTNFYSTTVSSPVPHIERVFLEEETSTPELISFTAKVDRYKEAREIVPIIRNFKEEELLKYNYSLDKLFKPIGVNIFDL